jgi:hypothetical protein
MGLAAATTTATALIAYTPAVLCMQAQQALHELAS